MLTEDLCIKRFRSLNPSQDSIQTTSMWVLHYKDSVDVIVKSWMECYKNADDNLRVALIYLMNDVVQKSTKKGRGDAITMAFHPYVVNAITLASAKVKKAIGRCLEIFEQRKVFPNHIIEEMKNALDGNQGDEIEAEQDEGLSVDIEIPALIKEIESYRNGDVLMEKAREILSRSDFNLKQQLQDRMKDRAEGAKMLSEMEDSKDKLNGFKSTLENHQRKCLRLIKLMQNAKQFFTLQLRDVTIVDDAYEKFGHGIRQTRRELEDFLRTGVFPGMSPPKDAPSPDASDDLNIEEVLKESNAGIEDMEMSDEEPSTSATKSGEYVAPLPNVTPLDPRLQRILHHQAPMSSGQSSVEPDPKAAYIPPSPLADPRQIPRPFGMPPFSVSQQLVSRPPRVDITQPPPNLNFQSQHPSPRPSNLIDPRQQKQHLGPAPYLPHSPMVKIPPFNPNTRPPPIFNQPNLMSPVGIPSPNFPPGMPPNFTGIPPNFPMTDTDFRNGPPHPPSGYLNGASIRPMNRGSMDSMHSASDGPPGVEDSRMPPMFQSPGFDNRRAYNMEHNR